MSSSEVPGALPDARPEPTPAPQGEVDRPSTIARVFAVMIPAGICLVGVAFAGVMIGTRPQAERTASEDLGLPVVTVPSAPRTERLVVRAHGQVLPARQVALMPEVTGRVVAMNPNLVPGGRVAAGEQLLRIDARDYRAALQQQAAQVQSSEVSLSQEESRRVIAQREWALLGQERGGATDTGRELALREPQTRAAQASVQAAQAGLRRARTNLARTTVTAPFDAFVQAEAVDIGQLVGPSSQLATLVGTDHFWVRVSIPVEELAWIRFPDESGAEGSAARVVQRVGEQSEIVRTGRVIRLYGDLDPVGRMARVLVEVDDPLGLQAAAPERGDPSSLPMLLGAFVDVEIEAGEISGVYEIPRTALHAGDTVHLFGDGQLEIREVDVVWRRPLTVLARGLEPTDELITSALATPIPGTRLRHAEEVEAPSEPAVDDDDAQDTEQPEAEPEPSAETR